MKLTVITINLNNSPGLENSINSFISQRRESLIKLEYIVVDGNSSDNSIDIINRYENYIDVLIIESDKGIFDAMNKGILKSSGDYVYFLNSGDVFYDENVLDKICNIIIPGIGDVIFVGLVSIHYKGIDLGKANLGPWIPHQGAFVPCEIMKSHLFNANYKVFGDLDLWTRLKSSGKFHLHCLPDYIAKMELDGVGTHPRYFLERMKDKYLYAKIHGGFAKFFLSFLNQFLTFGIYITFGENFYYKRYLQFVNNNRSFFHSIWKQKR